MFPLIKIIRLSGNLIQISLLLFEIESFEVTKKSYLKKLQRYLNEIFSESSFIDVLLAYQILNL